MPTRKRSTTRRKSTTGSKRVSAKRSAAAKKAWRTRRRNEAAGMSGLSGLSGTRRSKYAATIKQCSNAGFNLKVNQSSRAGKRMATKQRRGGCKP